MLSLEYLLEEAEANALPVAKKRAIIREYLQTIILSNIYRHELGKKVFFMGGTALRFFYRLPRFSEDLDFNSKGLTDAEFNELVEKAIKPKLSNEGFEIVTSYKKRKNLLIAYLKFNNIIKIYNISDKRGPNLMIKIEINEPKWQLITEPNVLSLYGYNFSSILMSRGNLLSEKTCALLSRKRGRDIYDLLFMLKRKFPFNKEVLKANKIKLPVKDTILAHLNNLTGKELKFLADQVAPFLFKEEDAELVEKAPLYGERLLREY